MKKLFVLLFLLLTLCVSTFACAKRGDGDSSSDTGNQPGDGAGSAGGDNNGDIIEGDHIFSPSTKVNIVYNGNLFASGSVSEIYYSLSALVDVPPVVMTDEGPVGEHEIVIGKSNRAVSKEAYRRLGLMERENSDYHGYVIYSDGNSAAIAYDEDIFDLHMAMEDALGYFVKNCFSAPVLRLDKGVVKSDLFNIIDRQREIDEIMLAERWQSVEKKLAEAAGNALAADIVKSMKNCYSLFSDNVIYWFANLYDPAIGGYYYSNSGRNTVGYGPDLESTYQALSFMNGTGMAEGIDKSAGEDVIPEWMQEQILKFAMELQDPVSGYFYHPQWGGESFDDRRELVDNGYTSRRGRDLKWALNLISRFGGAPTYDIPAIGLKGSGLLYDGSSANKTEPTSKVSLTARLGGSTAMAVSKIVSSSASIPTHLQSVDNMRAYLNGLDVNGDSYYVGNLLESQANQIVERDKQLDPTRRTTPLATVVKEYFDAHQNKENGAWTLGDEITYETVNGILKISGVYNGIQKEFPNPIKAIETAMVGIALEDAPTTVCYVLNPWYAITMLIQNVEEYNSSSNKAEVEAKIAELRGEILKNAPKLIDITRNKTAEFRKPDGSFSYFPDTSGPNSQGLPVAVMGSIEGDVNATHMFISGIPNHIFGILGCDIVPIFTVSDRMRYWTILNELGGVVKDEVVPLLPEDYEEEDIGTLPFGVTSQLGKDSEAEVMTTLDKNGKSTKALGLKTLPGSTDILRLSLNNYKPFYNAVVFEADIKIESAGGGGQFEMLPYGSPGDAYRIIIDYADGGNVTIRHISDFGQTKIGNEGEWIRLKLQYSYADIDYDRNGTKDLYVKIFANGSLISEGYTPVGAEPVKESSVSGIRFFSWTAADATLYLDNTLFYQEKVELKPAPIANPEDDSDRITFEESTSNNIPGKVSTSDVSATGEVVIKNEGTLVSPDKTLGLISKSGAADTLKFYITKKADRYNAVAFETDIKITAVSENGEIEFYFATSFNSTASKLIFSYTKGGDVVAKRVNAQGAVEFTQTVAKEGQWFKLRIEYTATADEAVIKLYAGESLIASGSALYNSFHAAENVNMAKLTVEASAAAEIYFDDLMFEQLAFVEDGGEDSSAGGITFEEDTLESIKDSLDLAVTDKASAEIVEDIRGGRLTKALRLVSPKDSLDTLVMKLSGVTDETKDKTNTVAFEGDFKITDADGGNILTLYHKTEDGSIANKIVFGWSAGTGNIFVLNSYDGDSKKDFDTVVVSEGMNAYFRLRVEYTKLSDTAVNIGFYVNGVKAADIGESHPYETPAIDADDITEIVFETYQARKTTIYVDNLTIERTNLEINSEGDQGGSGGDTPVTPNPEIPTVPKDEYDGSIFDNEIDSSVSTDNWT